MLKLLRTYKYDNSKRWKSMKGCSPICKTEDKYDAANIVSAVRETKKSKVTIVIPIYNAYEEVLECLNSVKRNTIFPYNVVVVNDCSTDKRVKPFLEKFCNENDNFSYVENEKNEGFVFSVNRGIRLCDTDVVILNSDVIVTKGWLKKLVIAAYCNKDIMTVTPLSNAAGMFSVPEVNKKNELPKGWSLEETANLIEIISNHEYESVPTGNGFCMYIKRRAFAEVGEFDEESFGKGYCEENDFCMKLLQKDFYNVIADDTFIYHKHNVTFKKEKRKLLKKNMKILTKRYPQYDFLVYKMATSDSLENVRRNIKKAFVEADKGILSKTRILIVVTKQVEAETEERAVKMVEQGNECFVIVRGIQETQLYQVTNKGKQLVKQHQVEDGQDYNICWENICFEVLYDKHIDIIYDNENGNNFSELEEILQLLNVLLLTTDDEKVMEK